MKPKNRLWTFLGRGKLKLKLNEPKITPKENLSREAEWGWHGCAPRLGVTVPKRYPKYPKTAQVARPNRATWHDPTVPHGTIVPLGCPATFAGPNGLAVLRGSDSVGLLCNAFSQL